MTMNRLTVSVVLLPVTAMVMLAAETASAQVQSLGTSRTTTGTGTTTARTGTTGGGTGVSMNAATNSAAASAGSQIQNQNLFSAAGDAGQIGNTQGRFAGSQLASQPLATGTTQTTQRTGQVTTVNSGRGGGAGGGFGGGNRNTPGTQATTRSIRPSLALGFPRVPRPAADMTQSVGERFAGLSTRLSTIGDTRPQFSGVSFNIGENGVVTLSGTVPDADARRLAANIVRMEPGVRSVTNELEVAAVNP